VRVPTSPRFWWSITAAYAALIIFVGSRPDLRSPVTFPMWDKFAHLGEYGVFGLLGHMAIARDGRVRSSRMLAVAVAGLCVGVLDETIQAYTPGRESSIYDLLADVAGVLLGITLARFIVSRRPWGGAGRRAK
jgi:VanZ family protein